MQTFDLTIRAAVQGYTLQIAAATVGEPELLPFALPFALTALPRRRKAAAVWVRQARTALRRGGSEEQRLAAEFGQALFSRLFVGEGLAAYRAALARLGPDERLLLRLRLPPELTALPWELLYDPVAQTFLALDQRLALVRYPELPQPLTPLPINGPLRVVAVLASPESTLYAPLRLDRELTRVRAALQPLEAQGRVQLDVLRGPRTLSQLRTRLREPVHVLHLIGHGDIDPDLGEGVLVFEDADGKEELVNAGLLREYLRAQRGQTRLVVLNACLGALPPDDDPFASLGLALVQAGVPAVIAMQFEVPDDVAADLAEVFYDELAAGQPVDLALSQARLHLFGKFRHALDWAVPVLFLRSSDGVLFDAAGQSGAAQRPLRAPTTSAPEVLASLLIEGVSPEQPASSRGMESPARESVDLSALKQRARLAYFTARQSGDWAGAIQLLEQASRLDPADSYVAQKLTEARRQLDLAQRYAEARELRAAEQWQALLGALAELDQLQPGFPDSDGLRAWAEEQRRRAELYEQALAACDAEDWPQAATVLDSLLAANPDDAQATTLRDLARRELEQRERAQRAEEERRRREAEAQRQREAEQHHRDELYAQALAAADAEDWTQALTALDAILATHPNDSQALALRERTRRELELREQAQRAEEERRRREAEAQRQREAEQRRAAEAQARQARQLDADRRQAAPARTDQQLGLPSGSIRIAAVALLVVVAVIAIWQSARRGTAPDPAPTAPVAAISATARATEATVPAAAATPLPSWVPELVEVPAGPFLMGSSDADSAGNDDETPQHELTLPTYWIGKTEVTNAQFRPFVEGDGYTNAAYWTEEGWQWREENARTQPAYWDDAKWNSDQQPVVGVSWYEAMAYCRWLSAQTGQNFVLPSEAEWEKAARGTDGRVYPWGNDWDTARANSNEASDDATTPVGQYPDGASPYGTLDMAGNVWEWTRSEYKPYPYNPDDGRESGRDPAQKLFTIRGGSWFNRPIYLRAANRSFNAPDYHVQVVGFRLARHLSS
jgi:formylglycine-generating enzyme required for sulfatase activity